jgi:transposase-like protein
MDRSLKELDLVVLMIDGVRITKDVVVVVALGIDTEGVKHVLGLRQGSTENSRVVTMLLENLMERGLNVERPLLVVIDGAKALRSAVRSILGEDIPVQRCTVHKARNVEEEVPKKDRPWVRQVLQRAYKADDEKTARSILNDLIEKLETIAPQAARSLEEGLDETLTVHRLGLPPLLRTSLRSTNMLESANNGVRDRTRNLKRWQNGRHANAERWVGAGLLETEKGFRAIKGHKQLSILVGALESLRKQSEAA